MPGIWKKDIERLRQFVEAAVHVLRTGVARDDLPERSGKPNAAIAATGGGPWPGSGTRDGIAFARPIAASRW